MTGAHGNQVVNGGGSLTPGGGAAGVVEALPESRVGTPNHTISSEKGGEIGRPVLAKVQTVVPSNGTVLQHQPRQVILSNMAAVPTTGAAAGAQVSGVPLQQGGMQIMNMRPAQGNIMQPQQVRSFSPRMILNSQMLQGRVPGQVLPGSPGHLLVKTENGQMHLVRVNHAPGQQQAGAVTVGGSVTSAALPATSTHVTLNQVVNSNNAAIVAGHQYRFPQSQVSVVSSSGAPTNATFVSATSVAAPAITSVVNSNNNFTTLNNIIPNVNTNSTSNHNNQASTIISNHNNSIVNNSTAVTSNNQIGGVLPMVGGVTTSQSNVTSLTPVPVNNVQQTQQLIVNPQQQQQMNSQTISAESAKNKCKNFLATLLKLAGEQKQPVAKNVRSLIQGLIDSKVEPEPFTEELQKLLNSSPQPCLVPFLKKTLPCLRLSLARGEINIDGVNPPPLSNTSSLPGNTTVIPAMAVRGVVTSAGVVRPTPDSGTVRLTSVVRPFNMQQNQHLHHQQQQQQPQLQQQQHSLVTNSNNPITNTASFKASVLRPPLPQQQQQIRLPNKTAVVTNSVGLVRIPNPVLVQQQQQQEQQQLQTTATSVITNSSSSIGSTNSTGATVVAAAAAVMQGNSTVLQRRLQQSSPGVAVIAASSAAQQPQTMAAPVSAAVMSSMAGGQSSMASSIQQQQASSSTIITTTTTSTTNKPGTILHTNKINTTKDRTVKEKQSFADNVADDDINDVAAMGGVNLGEESQRILDSTGFVGTQIRSCKDETFLMMPPLTQRLKNICAKHDMEEPSKEFAALLSHAVQERLKTIVEKLSVIAEHRLDIVKNEPRYEPVQDVKGQLRFLEDLDRVEKKRKDEAEREMLLRAAKSRNKNEDPEQAKLKAKAKEMQRVELEEMRQRDANMAALKALQGPRKKAKLDLNTPDEGGTFGGTFSQKQLPLRQRTKRVNLRDLTFLMEQDKDMNKSSLLYRTYLK